MFLEGYKTNFQTLLEAVRNGDVLLMECQDKATGKLCAVVCAVSLIDGYYETVPFARLFDGNPYEELNPPHPGGGWMQSDGTIVIANNEG